tara:strand:- start:921 stop:1043 length:123 start_codon:yes stop_codon:yes gene_type:complete
MIKKYKVCKDNNPKLISAVAESRGYILDDISAEVESMSFI